MSSQREGNALFDDFYRAFGHSKAREKEKFLYVSRGLSRGLTHMRNMCVGVAEAEVNPCLFLSFSFFSDKRKELYK